MSLAKKNFELAKSVSARGDGQGAMRLYKAALACNPTWGEARYMLSIEMERSGSTSEAIDSMMKAARMEPKLAGDAFFEMGVWHSRAGDYLRSRTSFAESVRMRPERADGWSNLGVVNHHMGRFQEALEAYRTSIRVQPTYATSYFNVGKVMQELGDVAAAVEAFEQAVRIRPTYFEAYASWGGALTPFREWRRASEILRESLKLNPSSAEGLYLLAFALMHFCQWPELEGVLRELRRMVLERMGGGGSPGVEPYASLTFPWEPEELKAIAEYHARVAEEIPRQTFAKQIQSFKYSLHAKRLKVSFKSYDIGDHQSSYLISSVLIKLSKSKNIDVSIYCLRPHDRSVLRVQIQEAYQQRFFDVSQVETSQIAEMINKRKTHILVDLDTHFRNSRLPLMAFRSSPVQVIYPFFVGTGGAKYLPIMFNDKIAAPPEYSASFIEKMVYLPDSYYVTSHSELPAGKPPAPSSATLRASHNLPQGAVVICNFNQVYKIDGNIFATWMEILRSVNNSLLWLRTEGDDTHRTMRHYARRLGVRGERIQFARWAETSESHIERIKVSSLSLDTPLYSSMTTGCDLLWAGVPLLSSPSQRMVGRLGASLLSALQVPQLIARDLDDYVEIAVRLTTYARQSLTSTQHNNPYNKLMDIIWRNRMASALFNSTKKVNELERSFYLLWEVRTSGHTKDGSSSSWPHVVVSKG